jgi:alkanesulfonate monooxygenase SsuD/methylene tetrahydromethanopterin reductase-like flavin-dependent oxidoreductase (luciferase family)/GNAT superfamily N-acetyltransferase
MSSGIRSIAFLIPGNYEDDDPYRGLEDTLRVFEHGERLGFDGAWVRQRHLEHGVSSAATFLAAATQRTRRIELGSAVIPIGYESPFRLAEDLSTADVLSRGRLQVGVSAGIPPHIDLIGDRVFDGDWRDYDLAHGRVARLKREIEGDFIGGPDTVVHSPGNTQRPRLQPHSPGLATRLWYGAGSLRSAQWAGENGLNLLSGNVISVPGAADFIAAQQAVLGAYRAALPGGLSRRIAIGRVIVPTDGASPEARERYRRYAEGRYERTLVAHGERQTRFPADLVGSSAEIIDKLLADPVVTSVSELRIELPYEFSIDDYRQILGDFREHIAPALGWRPREDTPLVIRQARPEEYARVGELTHAAYARDYTIGPDYAHQLLHPEERTNDYDIWVAEDAVSGELLGTTSILRETPEARGRALDDELYFRLLAVAPSARRRGIGVRLTELAFDLARERGLRAVALNSGEDMVGAHALYRSLGFERIPDRDVHFGEGDQVHTVYTFARAVDVPARGVTPGDARATELASA